MGERTIAKTLGDLDRCGAWQPIASAPKDKRILLYGTMMPFEGLSFNGPVIFSGYWDEIDEAWCGTTTTYDGPFFRATHWQSLPEPPR